jgi:chloramphenicol O-acetyltransferase
MILIPSEYEPKLLEEKEKEGYLGWSLDFFTKTDILQTPCLDITIQLEVTQAYNLYQSSRSQESTFFAFLLWHLGQILPLHPCFNLRLIEKKWYIINNPPIIVPVAVGGKERFAEMVLENISKLSYREFVEKYSVLLKTIREGKGKRPQITTFLLSCPIGNLPNLQFTGLTLHWQKNAIEGQPMFYFGKRYWQQDKLYIPFAAKLHHGTTDPYVLDLLIQDFQNQFTSKK